MVDSTFVKVNKKSFLNKKLTVASLWLLVIGGVSLYNFLDVNLISIVPACQFYKVTGLYCAGCGGTRAVHNLLKGDIVHSIQYNFIPFFSAAFILLLLLQHSLNTLAGTKLHILSFRTWMLWPIAFTVAAFWILRNL